MSISDQSAQGLHDRATRGIALTPEEQARLDSWYSAQDNAEMESLCLAAVPALSDLQSQVTLTIERCAGLARRIQELADENDALRREISSLREWVP